MNEIFRYIKSTNGKNEEKHKLCVLKVLTKNVLGHPMTAEFIEDQQTTHVDGDEEFVTAWVPSINFEGDLT